MDMKIKVKKEINMNNKTVVIRPKPARALCSVSFTLIERVIPKPARALCSVSFTPTMTSPKQKPPTPPTWLELFADEIWDSIKIWHVLQNVIQRIFLFSRTQGGKSLLMPCNIK